MRIAYLDCFSGISGDMFLGALVDAGVDPDLLRDSVRSLNVGAELQFSRVTRSGLSATKADVIVGGVKDAPRDEHTHEHHHHYGEHHHRGLKEILEIIAHAPISATAKRTASAIFQNLGKAEAKIHNCDIESVHFHEVGAADAIVDIVCAAVGAEALGVSEWRCSALNVGGGTVHCAHGTLPVPAPATLELLGDAPVYSGPIQKELVTPTGAAIVRTLATSFGTLPSMRVDRAGYGAGTRDIPGSANVLRIVIGEASAAVRGREESPNDIIVIEANVDDMTPQVFGYVLDKLLEAGALDAFGTQAHMKKNRPGMLLTVLAVPKDEQRLSELIFAETTTIGLRTRVESRRTLERRFVTVATEWGDVKIKLAELDGRPMNAAPEFEDCRRIAVEHGVALKRVMAEAMRIFQQGQSRSASR